MNDVPRSDGQAALDVRRRKLLYRAGHRGMKEMDLLLGGYVESHIRDLSNEALGVLERLLDESDQDLLAWMTGQKPVPERWDGELFRDIVAHQREKAHAER